MTKKACAQIVGFALLSLALTLAGVGCRSAELDPASMKPEDRLSNIHRAISASQAAPLGGGLMLHAESASFDESGALVLSVAALDVPGWVVPWRFDSVILRPARSGLLASLDMTNSADARDLVSVYSAMSRIGIAIEHVVGFGPVTHE